MTPSKTKAIAMFEKIANDKNINLDKVDTNWIAQMIQGAMMCNFKTEKLFTHFVETALSNIPKEAKITTP